jgi:hypothetical protein
MPIRKHPWTRLLVVLLFAACAGCGGKSGDDRTPAQDDGVVAESAKPRPRSQPKPEPPPTIPKLVLSKEFADKCRVSQGDQMPDADLRDLEGKPKTLKSMYGRKLTVVCLWSAGAAKGPQLLGLKQILRDLAEIGGKHKAPDVQLLGVNVKDSPEVAGELLKDADVAFANVLDPQGTFFDKVGTDALPRVYLLDESGRILWLDLLQLTSFDSNLRQLEFYIGIELKRKAKEAKP